MTSPQVDAASWIEYLLTIDTPTLSNAVEKLDRRPKHEGFTPCDIRCLFPELGRLCGWAVTAQVETITESSETEPSAFPALFRAVAASPKPVVVAYQEIGARPEYAAHTGEVISSVLKRLGAAGLVTDGAVRDVPEVRALGFHYFARGSAVSHGNFRVVRVGVPIQLMGMTIRSGDLLHGDENGLLQVPHSDLEGLRAAVEEVRSKEAPLLDYIRGPQFDLDEVIRRLFH